MRYVLTFTPQTGGSEQERLESQRRAQQLISKFEPSQSVTIHQWVTRVDGDGGFAFVETGDEQALLRDLTLWGSLVQFRLYPVIDMQEATPIITQALDQREQLNV